MPSSDSLRRRHHGRLERRIARLELVSRRFSWARLAVVVAGAVTVFALFRSGADTAGVLGAAGFVVVFIALVKGHDRVEESSKQTAMLRAIKKRHLSRRALDWAALPEPEEDAGEDPFALDLNLIGPRSLHHVLDASASRGGSLRLRSWLTDPEPDFERVRARQQLVRQLVPLELFRDRLARLSTVERGAARWDDRHRGAWLARREVVPRMKPWLIGLAAFSATNVALILAHIFGWLPAIWPATVLIYFAVYFMKYRSVDDVFTEAQDLDLTLQRFTPALVYIERFRFPEDTEAWHVTEPMRQAAPSRELRSLQRIAAFSAVTRSELMWLLLNLLLPWELLFTYLMHRTKRSLRERLPAWLDVWYTLEAAASLASYADYHDRRVFPELAAGPPVFEGAGLGHPLIREEVKVRNDVAGAGLGDVILITGSNMSGKSTFLRTLGVNLRLAYAGGPVDATSLHASCFRVFTSINVVDSVQEGLSHFYAEVQRLKQLLDALRKEDAPPVLALIDEIFRGTNNRERLIGSRSFVRALAGRRAISFISTHDLELTALEAEVPELRNYHFREEVSGERMTFDYTLRPGPCPTTNALKIMALAGLPVDVDDENERREQRIVASEEGSGPPHRIP